MVPCDALWGILNPCLVNGLRAVSWPCEKNSCDGRLPRRQPTLCSLGRDGPGRVGWPVERRTLDVTDQTDEQLAAEAAREGSDGPAFVELLSRYRDRVWRICYRLMGSETDTNDAAQEVFVRLFVNRTKFEGRSKYSTWVHAIAVRTCLSLRRGRGRRRRHEGEAAEEERRAQQAGPTDDTELALDLMQMLEALSEEDRAMLIMKHAEAHSYDDLAEMFDMSVSACKMRISRARARLRELYPDQVS